jgi:penicillin V acylase-like amidase (Ntn superfamily)
MRTRPFFAASATGLVVLVALASPARQCVRVLWNNSGRAVVVGRIMNWSEDTRTNLWAFPRGAERVGLADKNPLKWTAKYGSVAAGFHDTATADGVNERGLAVSVLWLDEADYGTRDESVPGLSTTLWGQFYLDTFATVAEAVRFTESTPFQLAPVTDGKDVSRLHLALADAAGDSAVIEYVAGKPRVYRGRESTVMAAKLLANLPKLAIDLQAAADLFGLLRAVSLPHGTRWRAVADLTNRVYYFESAAGPAVVWVRLDRLKFDPGCPVLKLDLAADPDVAGEASGKFLKSDPLKFTLPGG